MLCRGSQQEGLGHVMRTSSVALALREADVATHIVVIGDSSAAAVLGDHGVAFHLVADEEAAVARCLEDQPRLIVFDLVDMSHQAFDALQDGRPTASISPVFNHMRRVDASFSRARHDPDPFIRERPESHRRSIEYAIVGSHARAIPSSEFVSTVYDTPLSVGISMGGTDAPNLTLRVLEQLRGASVELLFWVMLGEGYGHSYEELVASLRKDRRHEIVLAKTTRSMWTVLRRCNLVLLAGGITTFEAAHAGMPSVNLLREPAHAFLLEELVEAGAVTCVAGGDWGDQLTDELGRLDADRDELFLMHRRGKRLIDGGGAQRVAAELQRLLP